MSEGSTETADEYRARSAQNWEEAAGSWEQKREYTRKTFHPLTEWLRDPGDAGPGQARAGAGRRPGRHRRRVGAGDRPRRPIRGNRSGRRHGRCGGSLGGRRGARGRDRVPGRRCRGDRPARPELRRGGVPVRADADTRPGRGPRRDAASLETRWPVRPCGVGRRRPKSLGHPPLGSTRAAGRHPRVTARVARDVLVGRPHTPVAADRRRGAHGDGYGGDRHRVRVLVVRPVLGDATQRWPVASLGCCPL